VEITEVRVKLVSVKNDKLRAFCSITVDNDFVIRDLKVIEGAKGAFVAMPSRKLTDRCPRCGGKNHYRARFCNDCGARLNGDRGGRGEGGNQKMHTDIAHPINSKCREVIQKKVLEVYQEELQKSNEPGYKPMELEVFDEEGLLDELAAEAAAVGGSPAAPAPASEGPPMAPGEEAPGREPQGSQVPSAPAQHPQPAQSGAERGQGGGRFNDRRQGGRPDQGRGRFRRGGRHRDNRDGGRDGGREGGGRGDRRGNGGGRPERSERPERQAEGSGGDRSSEPRWQHGPNEREGARVAAGSEGTGIPERDRETFLGVKSDSGMPPQQKGQPPVRPAPETEPEDNFGAGLFS
jgi:stage V sporulation protein G